MTRTRITTLTAAVAVVALIVAALIVEGPTSLMQPSPELAAWLSGLFR